MEGIKSGIIQALDLPRDLSAIVADYLDPQYRIMFGLICYCENTSKCEKCKYWSCSLLIRSDNKWLFRFGRGLYAFPEMWMRMSANEFSDHITNGTLLWDVLNKEFMKYSGVSPLWDDEYSRARISGLLIEISDKISSKFNAVINEIRMSL